MARKANEIFDESFVEKYVKIIEEKAPLIREDIMYKMKDIHKKSNEKVDSDEEQMGKLGVTLFAARKEPQILEIKKDGAAEKEDLEVFDKILGVEGGTVFESQKYFYDFIDTTSPGDRVVFIIERNSEEMKKRIELQ
jgi:C-terminal processing protease CtpA/Prc